MIRPENIGRADFKFTIKDGKLDGRIVLQNQEAADFFKANIEELRAVFQKSNIEFGKLDINLAGQSFANGEICLNKITSLNIKENWKQRI